MLSHSGPPASYGWDFLRMVNDGRVTLSSQLEAYLSALYDDSIRSVDQAIYELFEKLKARGLYDNALIIVTADHGEGLGDHGRYGHGDVYEECARIPLLVRFPGGRFGGTRYSGLVQLADLYPTILDVLGLPASDSVDGRSLLQLIERKAEARTFSYVQRFSLQAVRTADWKLVYDTNTDSYQAFRLGDDKGEGEDRYEEVREETAPLKKALHAFYAPDPGGWHLKLDARRSAVNRRVLLWSSGVIESARLLGSDRDNAYVTMEREKHSIEIDWSRMLKDEIIVRTAPSEAVLFLRVRSPGAFTVRRGSETIEAQSVYATALDPEAQALGIRPADVGGDASETSIQIWYVESESLGTPARDLNPEELESLEALGYLE